MPKAGKKNLQLCFVQQRDTVNLHIESEVNQRLWTKGEVPPPSALLLHVALQLLITTTTLSLNLRFKPRFKPPPFWQVFRF